MNEKKENWKVEWFAYTVREQMAVLSELRDVLNKLPFMKDPPVGPSSRVARAEYEYARELFEEYKRYIIELGKKLESRGREKTIDELRNEFVKSRVKKFAPSKYDDTDSYEEAVKVFSKDIPYLVASDQTPESFVKYVEKHLGS